jgi:hypothetical protein
MIDSASLYSNDCSGEGGLGFDNHIARRLEDMIAKCIGAECYCGVCSTFYSKSRIKKEMLTI